MTVFGLLHRTIPALGDAVLGKVHFWLYQAGVLCLLTGLFLMISGTLPEATVGPFLAVFEGVVLLSILAFLANMYRSA